MFPIAHAQAQTSIANYQFVSSGFLVSLSSAFTMSYKVTLKQSFVFLVISSRIFLVVKPGNMLSFDSEFDLQK